MLYVIHGNYASKCIIVLTYVFTVVLFAIISSIFNNEHESNIFIFFYFGRFGQICLLQTLFSRKEFSKMHEKDYEKLSLISAEITDKHGYSWKMYLENSNRSQKIFH